MAFPDDPEDLEVGFAFGHSAAEDPTGLTYDPVTPESAVGSVLIARGRIGNSGSTAPTRIAVALDDPDGEFSPRNATGSHYGELRMGTPVQVQVDVGSGPVVRGRAAVPDWNPRWTGPDIGDRVNVEASGMLSRLGRDKPVVSALRSYIGGGTVPSPIAWWPMEDNAGATEAASGLPGGVPLRQYAGTAFEFGAITDLPGAVKSPDIGGDGVMYGPVSGGSATGWCVEASVLVTGDTAIPLLWSTPSGTHPAFVLIATTSLTFRALGMVTSVSSAVADGWHHVACVAAQDGADIDIALYVDGVLVDSDTDAGTTLGAIDRQLVGYTPVGSGTDNPAGMSVSHTAIYNLTTPVGASDAAMGFPGELASDRVQRLCDALEIPVDVAAGDSQAMGPQPPGDVLTLLRECEAADEGVLIERLDGRIGFDPRVSRYNVAVALALEFDSQVTDLVPFDDDRDLYNIITVSRSSGSSAIAEQETGPVGSNETTGVGPRPLPVTRNLESEAQLADHAGYLLMRGTINQPRYEVVLDLIANPDLIDDWLACDIGSRITVTGAPAKHVGYDLLDLILEGYAEEMDAVTWTVTMWLEPYGPYKVFELADPTADGSEFVGRLAEDEMCALRVAIDTDDTSVQLDPNIFRWTATADDFDPDLPIRANGEVMEVSTIATTAATYVAVGAASHAVGDVTPALYAGGLVRDWICLVTRTRSATGNVSVSDYERVCEVGNLTLWAKVHSGSESAQLVDANAAASTNVVSGFTFGLRGMPVSLDSLADAIVGDAVTLSNSSAQNIAYGGVYPRFQEGCVVLLVAGKNDDWTSVALPAGSGLTEFADLSTTSGDDQGLYAAYAIQTTPAVIPEGSLVVTGGASATSESMILCLAGGYQTLTVTRSVNGVVKSHAVGTLIEVEHPMVMGL